MRDHLPDPNGECFDLLDGPAFRIAAVDSHIPFTPTLEEALLPPPKT